MALTANILTYSNIGCRLWQRVGYRSDPVYGAERTGNSYGKCFGTGRLNTAFAGKISVSLEVDASNFVIFRWVK